jgi:SAM-dependent methyltransferase
MQKKIFLPGSDNQLKAFLKNTEVKDKSVLIIGANSEEIAKVFHDEDAAKVMIIVNDNASLLRSRLILAEESHIPVRLMEFDNTDFRENMFDIVYAQSSISVPRRNKILKEVRKILRADGIFCVGENIELQKNPPVFVSDIWESSGLAPLNINEINDYYTGRGFEILIEQDLSYSLKEFYSAGENLLKNNIEQLSEEEKTFNKKFLKKLSHESNAYLRLGADKHIGFKMLILRKADN